MRRRAYLASTPELSTQAVGAPSTGYRRDTVTLAADIYPGNGWRSRALLCYVIIYLLQDHSSRGFWSAPQAGPVLVVVLVDVGVVTVVDWQKLAHILLDALGDHVAEHEQPTWVQVMDAPGGPGDQHFALTLTDEPGALLGRAAPPECHAVGVVATGKARSEDGPANSSIGFPPGTTTRARMCCLVTREGVAYSAMLTPDGQVVTEPPTSGRLLDALRQCFGLGSPPHPAGAALLRAKAEQHGVARPTDEPRSCGRRGNGIGSPAPQAVASPLAFSGSSAVGSAPALGAGGRGFKSPLPDQEVRA